MSYRRKDGGSTLRYVMAVGGWKLQSLATRTREVDPAGKGVSFQLIAFLATGRRWGRETTSAQSAWLIEQALGVPVGTLFEPADIPVPDDSAQDREPQPVT